MKANIFCATISESSPDGGGMQSRKAMKMAAWGVLKVHNIPSGPVVKNPPANAGGHRFDFWPGKIPHVVEHHNY